jgi:hypothetical protein
MILAGLLLPGTTWAWARRWPAPWFAGGMLSGLLLFMGMVGLALSDLPVTGWTLGVWQSAWALAGLAMGRRGRPVAQRTAALGRSEWWIALPALPMLGVMVWRAILQPLSGADVDFRWNRLAEMMVHFRGLAHYPPITSSDFAQYFWPDGIAPLVAGLYAWTYLMAGEVSKVWTFLPVLLQALGLVVLLYELGRSWGSGERGGWWACALGGGTMLLQFAFNLGQETGLMALAVGGLALYLILWQRSGCAELLAPAAACATLAACAREYGLIYPLVGAVWILLAGRKVKPALGFGGAALALPALWHGRNWWFTGNPFYPLDIAGWFPLNPVFAEWMRGYQQLYGAPLHHAVGWREIGRLLAVTALPALVGGLAGLWWWRRVRGWAGSCALVVATTACWLASVPYTAGGLFYSMRVLSPLLVLGCGWGGACLAAWVPGRRHLTGLFVGCSLFAIDAAVRALTIPANPYQRPPSQWLGAGYELQDEFRLTNQPFLLAAARVSTGRTLSESAAAQNLYRAAGRELVPMWSPDVAFLFRLDSTDDKVARLQALGFTHVLLTRAQSSVEFLRRTGALAALDGHLQAVMANETFILFALVPSSTYSDE